MATSSFSVMLVIDTPEKEERLLAAFKAAEERGPLEFDEESIEILYKRGYEWLDFFMGLRPDDPTVDKKENADTD